MRARSRRLKRLLQLPPNQKPIDAALGDAIGERRRELGISQQALAAAIGVTFQTIQKYERGANRVSFSRCVDIAHALTCRIGDLIGGIDGVSSMDPAHPFPSNPGLRLKEAGELLRAYAGIPAPLRRATIELLKALADAKPRRGNSGGIKQRSA